MKGTAKYETILEKEISSMKQDIQSLEAKVDKLVLAIIGNKDFGDDGLVGMVRKHDAWIESQKFLMAKIYGAMAVIGGLWTYLIKAFDII